MDPMRLASLTDEVRVASAPSIGKFIGQALAERTYKHAWMDNWPELFGDWSVAERDSIDLATTNKIIEQRLLHHTGNSVPNGVYTVRQGLWRDRGSVDPIIARVQAARFKRWAGSSSDDPIKRAASSACPIIVT